MATQDAIKVLEQALYILEHYKINPLIKAKVLGNYTEALRREERHFEAVEYFQLALNINQRDEDLESEVLFMPSYFM